MSRRATSLKDETGPSLARHEVSEASLLRGSLWVSGGEIVAAIITTGVGIVAARLIEPRAFGAAGAVLLLTSMVEASTSSGFERALTQREGDVGPWLNVAWTWHVLRGAALTALLAVLAPLVARWYHEPALLGLMLAVSPIPLLRGLQNTALVDLARRLDFRRQLGVRLAQVLGAALLTLPALFLLRSAWGLCARSVIASAATVGVSFVVVRHRPRLVWDAPRLRELFAYGRWITGSTLMVFAITQGDDLFVGKYLGLEALGMYQMAFWLSNLPASHVAHLISRVTFPVYVNLQREPERLRRAFLGVLGVVAFLAFSVSAVLLVGTPALVEHVLGDRWQPAIPAVRLLTIAGLVRSVAGTGGALYQAIGRPDLEFKQNAPRLLVLILIIWPLAMRFGVIGVCVAVLLALVPALLVWIITVRRVLGLTSRDLFAPLAVALGGSIALGATLSIAARHLPSGPVGALGAATLGFLAWLPLLALGARLSGSSISSRLSSARSLLRAGGG